MERTAPNTLSFTSVIWLGIMILFLGTATAARPGYAGALAFIIVLTIAGHMYLRAPVAEDEKFDYVYPRRLAAVSIIVFLFMPHLLWKLGDLGLLIQFGIPLIVLLFANYHALKSRNFVWRSHTINVLILFVIGSILLSMVLGFLTKGVVLSVRDLLEIKAPIYYFLAFNLFYQLDWKPGEIKKYFLFPVIGGGLITVLVGFIQYMHFVDLNNNFFAYWTEEHHLNELNKPLNRRIFSTFSASGIYGVFLLFLIAHILAAIYSRHKVNHIIAFITLFASIAALFMTGTKSSFALFLVLLIIFPWFFYIDPRYKLLGSGITLVSMILITIMIWPWIEDSFMVQRMKSVTQSATNVVMYGGDVRTEELLDETSVGRYALWVLAMPRIKASPIYGYGPGKQFLRSEGFHRAEESEIRFESSYLQILVRYGIIGILVNFYLYFYMMGLQLKILKLPDCPSYMRRLASAHLVFFIVLLGAFLVGDFIYNIQVMSPLFASVGIGASYLVNER